MNSLTILSLIAAALELTVPAYGLRLIRRFGSRRVGWFLATAFCSLALLHLVGRLKTDAVGPRMLDMIVAFASGLLLIGMGHIETLCAQRLQTELEVNKLSTNWRLALNEKTADLARINQELLEEIARLKENQRVLQQSEQQYRFLFTESPQPQWIFDLRSLRFLAVNQAALQLLGFRSEEFMALTASGLLPAETLPFFRRDVAEPCSKAGPRGLWLLGKKDGNLIEVEISAFDLRYDGCPARLIVANDLAQHQRHKPEQVSRTATRAATPTRELLSLAGCNSIEADAVDPNEHIQNYTPHQLLQAIRHCSPNC